jgi:hypothetical protein
MKKNQQVIIETALSSPYTKRYKELKVIGKGTSGEAKLV